MGSKSHTDTSWLIALFNPDDSHHSKALRQLDELHGSPTISSFALAELLVDFEKSDVVDVQATFEQIKRTFDHIIDLTADIALHAAQIRSTNKVTLGDAIIIASALTEKAELLTFDKNMKAVYERIR